MALTDSYSGLAMAVTAENLADKYGITREEVDEFALPSQHAGAGRREAGALRREIVAVEMRTKKGDRQFAADEHPRPEPRSRSSGSWRPSSRRTAGHGG